MALALRLLLCALLLAATHHGVYGQTCTPGLAPFDKCCDAAGCTVDGGTITSVDGAAVVVPGTSVTITGIVKCATGTPGIRFDVVSFKLDVNAQIVCPEISIAALKTVTLDGTLTALACSGCVDDTGVDVPISSAGGSHGGRGGLGKSDASTTSPAAPAFGDAFAPYSWGQSGYQVKDGQAVAKTLGGGKIKLTAATLSWSASTKIIASGAASAKVADGGGGAGGSVWLAVTTLKGPETGCLAIAAAGGAAAAGSASGGGAGGRVAVTATTLQAGTGAALSYDVALCPVVSGGAGDCSFLSGSIFSAFSCDGSPGSFYVRAVAPRVHQLLYQGPSTANLATAPRGYWVTPSSAAAAIAAGNAAGNLTVRLIGTSLVVASGSALQFPTGSYVGLILNKADITGRSVMVNVDTLQLDAGSSINADGGSLPELIDPPVPSRRRATETAYYPADGSEERAYGGGHGGYGSSDLVSTVLPQLGGGPAGSAFNPQTQGGWGGPASLGQLRRQGGGTVRVLANLMTLQPGARISSNGQSGVAANGTSLAAGAGAGGSIWIQVADIRRAAGRAPLIQANGGDAPGVLGAGGGGRLQIQSTASQGAPWDRRWALEANGGINKGISSGPFVGGAGSVVVLDAYGPIIILNATDAADIGSPIAARAPTPFPALDDAVLEDRWPFDDKQAAYPASNKLSNFWAQVQSVLMVGAGWTQLGDASDSLGDASVVGPLNGLLDMLSPPLAAGKDWLTTFKQLQPIQFIVTNLTMAANTTIEAPKITINSTHSIDIGVGATLRAQHGFFSSGDSPCSVASDCPVGASYGGVGGFNDGTPAGPVYGSTVAPSDLGRRGGGEAASGRAGGGVFIFQSPPTVPGSPFLRLNGKIEANAGNTDSASRTAGAGGGSGGSVWILSQGVALQGVGSISANGGNATRVDGPGGGGRISITVQQMAEVPPATSAFGGRSPTVLASPGTIYFSVGNSSSAWSGQTLKFRGSVRGSPISLSGRRVAPFEQALLLAPSDSIVPYNNLILDTVSVNWTNFQVLNTATRALDSSFNRVELSLRGRLQLINLTLSNALDTTGEVKRPSFSFVAGGAILLQDLSITSSEKILISSSSANLTLNGINSLTAPEVVIGSASEHVLMNGSLQVLALNEGCLFTNPACSPSATPVDQVYGAGGGYGGSGAPQTASGTVISPGGLGGVGDVLNVDTLSYGCCGGGLNASLGFAGGIIRLVAGKSLQMRSTVVLKADGRRQNLSGGGSGGSVSVTARDIWAAPNATATFSANGANGYATAASSSLIQYSGAGGGGRIALKYSTMTGNITYTAFGGLAPCKPAVGVTKIEPTAVCTVLNRADHGPRGGDGTVYLLRHVMPDPLRESVPASWLDYPKVGTILIKGATSTWYRDEGLSLVQTLHAGTIIRSLSPTALLPFSNLQLVNTMLLGFVMVQRVPIIVDVTANITITDSVVLADGVSFRAGDQFSLLGRSRIRAINFDNLLSPLAANGVALDVPPIGFGGSHAGLGLLHPGIRTAAHTLTGKPLLANLRDRLDARALNTNLTAHGNATFPSTGGCRGAGIAIVNSTDVFSASDFFANTPTVVPSVTCWGGGVISINANNNVTLAAGTSISADAADFSECMNVLPITLQGQSIYYDGGAGGSVVIVTTKVTYGNTSLVTAAGAGTGGGGRIAVYSEDSPTLDRSTPLKGIDPPIYATDRSIPSFNVVPLNLRAGPTPQSRVGSAGSIYVHNSRFGNGVFQLGSMDRTVFSTYTPAIDSFTPVQSTPEFNFVIVGPNVKVLSRTVTLLGATVVTFRHSSVNLHGHLYGDTRFAMWEAAIPLTTYSYVPRYVAYSGEALVLGGFVHNVSDIDGINPPKIAALRIAICMASFFGRKSSGIKILSYGHINSTYVCSNPPCPGFSSSGLGGKCNGVDAAAGNAPKCDVDSLNKADMVMRYVGAGSPLSMGGGVVRVQMAQTFDFNGIIDASARTLSPALAAYLKVDVAAGSPGGAGGIINFAGYSMISTTRLIANGASPYGSHGGGGGGCLFSGETASKNVTTVSYEASGGADASCRGNAGPIVSTFTVIQTLSTSNACPENNILPSLLCPGGSFVVSGYACQLCAPGSFSKTPTDYIPISGASTRCGVCGLGTFSPGTGSIVCLPCAPGSYFTALNTTFCPLCPLGTAQPLKKQTSCPSCIPGTYADVPGMASCAQCEPGSYSVEVALKTKCPKCKPGFSTYLKYGAPNCTQCTKGYFAKGEGAATCTACQPGSYSAIDRAEGCTECTAGSQQPQPASTGCTQCEPGTVADEGAPLCRQCLPGTFQNAKGNANCNTCSNGTITATPGASMCTACSVDDLLTSLPGNRECGACALGLNPVLGNVSLTPTRFNSAVVGPIRLVVSTCRACDAAFAADRSSTVCQQFSPLMSVLAPISSSQIIGELQSVVLTARNFLGSDYVGNSIPLDLKLTLSPVGKPTVVAVAFENSDPTSVQWVAMYQNPDKPEDAGTYILNITFSTSSIPPVTTSLLSKQISIGQGDVVPYSITIIIIAVVIPVGCVCLVLIFVIVYFTVFRKRGPRGTPTEMRSLPVNGVRDMAPLVLPGIDFDALPKNFEIPMEDLRFENEVGRGAYGVVFKGEWRDSTVAIKRLTVAVESQQQYQKELKQFRSEAAFLKQLRPHKNVVLLLGITPAPVLCIVTEYCSDSLYARLFDPNFIMDEELMKKIVQGICAGMAHLHAESLVHRNLGARNILLDEGFNAKITDFGMSRIGGTDGSENQTKSDVGPLLWFAPECIRDRIYSQKSDIWSFGVTVWEIVARQTPYAGLQPLQAATKVCYEGLRLEIPPNCPDLMRQLMVASFATEAQDRPSFKQLAQYFRDS